MEKGTTQENKFILPLSFLTLALNYLKLASNALEETVSQGNIHMLTYDDYITEELYNEKTRWSDFRIIEPTLFNFYHGLELIMKGLLLLVSVASVESIHGLNGFLEKTKLRNEIPTTIKEVLEKHISPGAINSFLSDFLNENNLSVDQLYDALRYPFDKQFQNVRKYWKLHYKEEKSLEYFTQIVADITRLSREVVKFYRDQEKNNQT
jgi:hypothetical protein